MGIFTRIVRICKADIHGVMDQLEDKGLLLKQHLRDMEKALTQKEARLKKLMTSQRQTVKEMDKYQKETQKIERDLSVSIEKGRDDIARMLIRKLKPMTLHNDELQQHIEVMDREIEQMQETVEKQRHQYEQFQLKAKAFDHKREQQEWEKHMSSVVPERFSQDVSEEEVELELIQRKEAIRSS